MKLILKKAIPHLIAVVVLFIVSCLAFYPQLAGEKIVAGDIVNSDAKTKHIKDYMENDEELIYWNSAQFSGGPIFLLSLGKKNNLLRYVDKALTFNHRAPIGMFFMMSLIMYISLVSLRLKPALAVVFSIAHMFCLAHITLLEAGHFSKVYTLGYLPFVIAGLILVLKERYIIGGILYTLGLSLAIYSGHVQMIYYLGISLLFVPFFLPISFIVNLVKKNDISAIGKIAAVLILGTMLGVFSNFSQLYSSLIFSEKTMRGGDILEMENQSADNLESKGGLDWDYAMNWSYEKKDFFNILVPRIVGGGSQELVDKDNPISKLMIQNNATVKDGKVAIPGYWSSMPFTSGGAYIGASLFLLFILSLFILERKIALTGAVAFFVIFLLSLGEHAGFSFLGMDVNINRFFYNYLPMFDKFRAPSSAISILPPFIVILSALGLHKILQNEDEKNNFKKLLIGGGLTTGLIALIWIIGTSSFSFLSANDMSYDFNIQQILIEGRKMLFSSDVYRSLFFALAIFAVLALWIKQVIKKEIILVIALGSLFCLDLVPITKRYFGKDNFETKTKYETNFLASNASLEITKLESKGRGYYRVLYLTTSTFNDAKPSYHHNQIGGYDPTKLQRYQDMIDFHISPNIQAISQGLQNVKTQTDVDNLLARQTALNMLNCKYIIINPNSAPLINKNVLKNAWFVNQLKYVQNNKDEISQISQTNIANTAIINETEFGKDFLAGDAQGSIELSAYTPNKLVYQSNSNTDQLAVFSEVWYGGNPDWIATIDGQEAPIIRTNYILKAMQIPAGQHEIIMEFSPKGKGAIVSIISSLIILLSNAFFVFQFAKRMEEEKIAA